MQDQLPQIQQLNVLVLRDLILMPGTVGSLIAGRPASIAAINDAVASDQAVFLLAQKDSEIEAPCASDLFEVGVVAKILQVLKLPDNTIKLLVEVKFRGKIIQLTEGDYFSAQVVRLEPELPDPCVIDKYLSVLKSDFNTYLNMTDLNKSDIDLLLKGIDDLIEYADLVMSQLKVSIEEKQQYLEMTDVVLRVKYLLKALARERQWLELEQELHAAVKDEIEADQEAYVQDKKRRMMQRLLGVESEASADNEFETLHQALSALPIELSVKEKLLSDFKKLKEMPPASAEATVIRAHLEWVVDVPWVEASELNISIEAAKQCLDEDHYGLDRVKARILEHIAVQIKTKACNQGSILCFLGPPGVGKTSLGASIARAMGRKFVRIALGGVRDESEIRGHRKTYIGAMPGRIIKAMKRAGVTNPVILLDEIDKMGMDFRGDPASALLEVLDPEQNQCFSDHYLEVEYDLSQVVFITTANTIQMPSALLDRMEFIELSSYTEAEKVEIAKQYLVKKCLKSNGLALEDLKFPDASIRQMIRAYTQEAGVRDIERLIGKICRKVTYQCLEQGRSSPRFKQITRSKIQQFLGAERYSPEPVLKQDQVGQVHGMAWTSVGGVLLTIEALVFPGKGETEYTGSLGDVMKESMHIALSVVRSRLEYLALEPLCLKTHNVHVHVPEGATPKDGPSAGVAVCTALMSVLSQLPIRANIAMTGEITLRGEVLKIGGLKEKLLAAVRSGITHAIIPKANFADYTEIASLLGGQLTVHCVQWIDEVFELALTEPLKPRVVAVEALEQIAPPLVQTKPLSQPDVHSVPV